MTIRHVDRSGIFPADAQQIRFAGSFQHLTAMKALAPTSKIIIVHSKDDPTCPFANALELVSNLQTIEFDVEVHSIGHPALKNSTALRHCDPSDFERREDIRRPTPNGHFVVSDAKGYPEESLQSQ